MPSLGISDPAPDFSLVDSDGVSHSLADHRGRKVMLSFYRSAKCPFANYAIDELQGRYKKLAWAVKLDVIAVFQSSTENIDRFILKSRDTTKDKFPFVLLSDPELITYSEYEVNEKFRGNMSGIVRTLRGSADFKQYIRTFVRTRGIEKDTVHTVLPSDFLIDENGIIADCFRAKEIDEHIPLERINAFLLGQKSEKGEI
uniref:Thioredoxin domain-containing protein n=1 Tax=Ditylum brightwellii TaxID=49249 RepID=A0A6U3RC86_9STRA|mmetsp:Transcript_27680/g.41178  ORF Transcript_27680/g.41178 Transcript_27680/m.41178 type:complete len:200 (+) Transcript_27680:122-721(+)